MFGSGKIKKTAEDLFESLSEKLENTAVDEIWIKENKKRILCIGAQCAGENCGKVTEKVFNLTRELTEQSEGNINADTLEVTERFNLTFEEFDCLPYVLKLNLLYLTEKILDYPEKYGDFASATVKSLIELDKINFDILRRKCLLQERLLERSEDFLMSDERTKGEYRRKISEIALKSGMSEWETVEKALNFANGKLWENLFVSKAFYSSLNISLPDIPLRLFMYISAVIPVFALFVFAVFSLPVSVVLKIFLSVFAFPPVYTLTVNFENRIILKNIKPNFPLALKEETGEKTAVVLTVIADSKKSAEEILYSIEEHYVSNKLKNGVYVILADLKNSLSEKAKDDRVICETLKEGTEKLNKKYGDCFSCFVRKRQKQGREYFGRERKRGAIEDFIGYTLEFSGDFLLEINGKKTINAKYTVTLDKDTLPVPQSIPKLVCIASHPANANFGIIQPKISNNTVCTTPFMGIFSDGGGIDAYDTYSAEVFADYFLSGNFCGKGLIVNSIYKEKITGKIEPMTVLSHDLLEGELACTLRSGNVTFFDGFPETAISYFRRNERWQRGDWQLLPWLLKKLPTLSKFKIADNCIKSLNFFGIFAVAFLGIFAKEYAYVTWLFAIFALMFPSAIPFAESLFILRKPLFSDTAHIRQNSVKRNLIELLFLPQSAYMSLCSAFSGIWRRIRRKNALKWDTFASTPAGKTLKDNFKFFLPQIFVATLFFSFCAFEDKILLFPLFALWCIAPYFSYILGKKKEKKQEKLLTEETEALRILSVRTLDFFRTSLKDNNYVMPDNFQEGKGYAPRTSPTDLGFALLSSLCGLRTGVYSLSECADQLFKQTEQIKNLEKYRGHLFNWYNLKNLKPLGGYISSVDSGNFCVALLTVKNARDYMLSVSPFSRSRCKGIADTFTAFCDIADENTVEILREYANAFTFASKKEAVKLAEDFLQNLVVSEKFPFLKETVSSHLSDYRNLSFSELSLNVKELLPLKDMLEDFPAGIGEITNYRDFEKKLNECLWNVDEKKYAKLIDVIKKEYVKICGYAYSVKEKIDFAVSFATEFCENADFSFLYDSKKKLLKIGTDVYSKTETDNCYDILCSEARLTVLFCIATGKIPVETWFKTARPFSRFKGEPICLSWSGTAFEYLMPDIFIEPPENSVLAISELNAVKAQIASSAKNGLWGISESAYNSLDLSGEYKYRAFGVQSAAVSSFKEEKVFSPYSSVLALEKMPKKSMENIARFVELGVVGEKGFYEAYDMRFSDGETVYTYMAHHSGMILSSLTNFLHNGFIRKLFSDKVPINAVKTLLEEKMPLGIVPIEYKEESTAFSPIKEEYKREFPAPHMQGEETLYLKGDRIKAKISSRGEIKLYSGENYIGEVYVFVENKKVYSPAFYPVRDMQNEYRTVFSPNKCEFVCKNKSCEILLEITVWDNAFIVNVTVKGNDKSKISAVLVPALTGEKAYNAHPAFNGLFCEFSETQNGTDIFNKKTGFGISFYSLSDICGLSSDKNFVLGGDLRHPKLEREFKQTPITPCGGIYVDSLNGEKETFVISEKSGNFSKATANIYFERKRIESRALINSYELTAEEWLMALKIQSKTLMQCPTELGAGKKDTFWKYGLSDEIPLLTVLTDGKSTELKKILKICSYCFSVGCEFNVLVLQDTAKDYMATEFNGCEEILSQYAYCDRIFHTGGLTENEKEELKKVSFLFLNTENTLSEQIKTEKEAVFEKKSLPHENIYPPSVINMPDGEFDNGYGRFLQDGYYIYSKTPVPWSNIVTNGNIGFLRTESGGGYIWHKNSALNKITPWYNDPTSDRSGEIIYFRDSETNRYWTVTREPVNYGDGYDTFFGKGYVRYGYNGFGLTQTQTEFVHSRLPIKIISLSSDIAKDRDVDFYCYIDPVLGEHTDGKFTEVFLDSDAICACREGKYVLLYSENSEYFSSYNGFFGKGTEKDPEGLICGDAKEWEAGKRCLILKSKLKRENTVYICCGDSLDEVRSLKNVCKKNVSEKELEKVKTQWDNLCGRVKITTPDKKLNTLFNEWLIYQIMSSRMLGRCGFYQAGGAYGFRDQLQDCLALMYVDPEKVKNHILLCASHQFKEGDVQHWWHPPFTGVRTKISDDLLFLPFVSARYASVTGDYGIFSENVPYIEGHSLNERQDLYESVWQSEVSGSLYEHCIKAIKLVLKRRGEHSLPLILGGDWNDGMNSVGTNGKGESVWLGWFLFHVISLFLPVAEEYSKEDERILKNGAKELADSLNTVCWDGQWYLRAFFDDGRPIGSSKSESCKIDVISQAWSVLSGAGDPEKCKTALESAEKLLADKNLRIIKLLTPPFNGEAGYIGDYVNGVRENGGQYTHGAVWLASAFAQMGAGEKCYELLNMISPLTHSDSKISAETYKLEPYVMAADIYSNRDNAGRGGWSWYTGSASMYFCAVLNDLLGITKVGDSIEVSPHIPPSWREYEAELGNVKIKVLNPNGKSEGVKSKVVSESNGKKEIRVIM